MRGNLENRLLYKNKAIALQLLLCSTYFLQDGLLGDEDDPPFQSSEQSSATLRDLKAIPKNATISSSVPNLVTINQ